MMTKALPAAYTPVVNSLAMVQPVAYGFRRKMIVSVQIFVIAGRATTTVNQVVAPMEMIVLVNHQYLIVAIHKFRRIVVLLVLLPLLHQEHLQPQLNHLVSHARIPAYVVMMTPAFQNVNSRPCVVILHVTYVVKHTVHQSVMIFVQLMIVLTVVVMNFISKKKTVGSTHS